jgi:hypothetical protein
VPPLPKAPSFASVRLSLAFVAKMKLPFSIKRQSCTSTRVLLDFRLPLFLGALSFDTQREEARE